MKALCTILFCCLSLTGLSQVKNNLQLELDSLRSIKKEILKEIGKTSDSLLSASKDEYIELMEKTNGQLSKASTSHGILVDTLGVLFSALGVLFAILAIAAAFVIYRQGSEHRKQLDEKIESYQIILDQMVETAATNARSEVARIGEEMRHKHAELLVADDSKKEALNKDLEELEKRKKLLNTSFQGSGRYNKQSWEHVLTRLRPDSESVILKCPNCEGLTVFEPIPRNIDLNDLRICPSCQKEEVYKIWIPFTRHAQ